MLARAIASLVDPQELARAHQRWLAVFEARPASTRADAERLAFHAARAIDRQRALEYHERASAMAEAAQDDLGAARLSLRAAELARASGEDLGGERLLELGRRAASLALRGTDAALAREALGLLLEVFDARARPEHRVAVAVIGAEIALFEGDAGRAWATIGAVQELVPALGHAQDRGSARVLLATCALRAGAQLDFERVLRDAIADAAHAADAVLEGRALAALAAGFARADQITEADAAVAQALALAARVGLPEVRACSLAAMAAVLEALGDPAAASERLDEAAQLAGEHAQSVLLADLVVRSMVLKLRAGRDVAAAKSADLVSALARDRRSAVLHHLTQCARAVISSRTYPDPDAQGAFERASEGMPASALLERAFVAEMRAAALAALGDVEAAALARDDAAILAEAAGWASYARLLREPP
jgi:hypothetical protein